MKRGLGLLLAALLAVGVVAAVVLGGKGPDGSDGANVTSATAVTSVNGLIGSEKAPFFADQRVKDALARHGISVDVTAVGSRDMSTSPALGQTDFAFPSSRPAADKVNATREAAAVFEPFHSPLAVATFEPIRALLQSAGVVRKEGEHWAFDMTKYYELAAKGTRWDALPGNTAYRASKAVLVTTTDLRRSNSAAMYLALVAYVAGGKNVVATAAQADALVPKVASFFLAQGYTGRSTEEPFEDYLSAGMGKTPMVLIYEAQYLGRQIAGDGSIASNMVLMYPTPDVVTQHTLLAYTEEAKRLGELLQNDAELARLAATYGFRPRQPQVFAEVLQQAGVAQPPELVDIVEPPTYGVLERLLVGVEKLYG